MKHVFILILFFLTSCGKISPELIRTQLAFDEYKSKVNSLRDELPYCQYPTLRGVSKDTCISEGSGSGDGDVMLWSGLLCLSGEAIGCQTAKASFAKSGKPARSPGRVESFSSEFSRDMFLGSLAYFIGSRDISTSKLFFEWFKSNGNRLCFGNCDMRITTWGMFGETWKYLGLPLVFQMRVGMAVDDSAQLIASAANENYQLHLVGVTILLRQKMNRTTSSMRHAAQIMHKRMPANPFYSYLAVGANRHTVELALAQLNRVKFKSKSQWSFERPDSEQSAVEQSMLWEFVFLLNLLEAEL